MYLLYHLSRWSAILGAAIAVAVAAMTTVSVLGRYFIKTPISGDVELTQLGIGIALSLCVPWCQLKCSNIIVDFFTQKTSGSAQQKMDGIGAVLLGVMLLLLAWRTGAGAFAVNQAGETSMILTLPGWWVYAALAPGLLLAALICFAQASLLFRGKPLSQLSEPA
jgi:TRAP-type C4-dicarboxylate transport system permease small subunit